LDAAITLGALGANAASVPVGIAIDSASGDLLVADWANNRVLC
jgi:NHL repeat